MAEPDRHSRFLALLEAHRRILYKVARVYGGPGVEADDLVQETIAQLWQSFPRYDERLKFSTWMYRVALNVAISFQRREGTRKRHLAPESQEMLEVARDVEGPPSEDLALLYQSIARLDDLSKALAMLYLDGHGHADISEVLGISTANVSTRIGRLKDRLRADMKSLSTDTTKET